MAFDPDAYMTQEGIAVRGAPVPPTQPLPFDPDAYMKREGIDVKSAVLPKGPTPPTVTPLPVVPRGEAASIRAPRPAFRPETLARGDLASRRGLALARGEDPSLVPDVEPAFIPATPEEMAAAGGITASPNAAQRIGRTFRQAFTPNAPLTDADRRTAELLRLPGDIVMAPLKWGGSEDAVKLELEQGKQLPKMTRFEAGEKAVENDQNLHDAMRKDIPFGDAMNAQGDLGKLQVDRYAKAVKEHWRMEDAINDAKMPLRIESFPSEGSTRLS